MTRTEVLDPAKAEAYRGTFAPGTTLDGVLPPGWEGLYFPFDAPLAGLRPDGSPADDGVAVDLPRRMYAGEDTDFLRPLPLGATAEQRVTVMPPVRKSGRAGALVFVDVDREYVVDGEVAVRSTWHDVFLESAPAPLEPVPDATHWDVEEPLRLDSRQLFRFSALTFNTHRIHYDRDFAREVEGLPDLLVHGPLVRVLLLDLAARVAPGRTVRRASVRMTGPVLVDTDVHLVARRVDDALETAVLGPGREPLATSTITFADLEEQP